MNEVLFQIVLCLIPILGIVITTFVIPFIKAKVDAETLNKIIKWTGYAVKCAEMIYKESGQGKLKKEYVINFITNMFNKEEVVITYEQMEILIEAAVQELNQNKQALIK